MEGGSSETLKLMPPQRSLAARSTIPALRAGVRGCAAPAATTKAFAAAQRAQRAGLLSALQSCSAGLHGAPREHFAQGAAAADATARFDRQQANWHSALRCSRRAAAITYAGGFTRWRRAQASFSTFEWQQQFRQQVSASVQPQGQFWQGYGAPAEWRWLRAGSGTPTEQVATVRQVIQAASRCRRGTSLLRTPGP
jgi:hypothetical protein